MLVNLQFLRFVAALCVVLHHAAAHVRVAGHAPGPLFSFGQTAGFAGVDLFFVISGFIMVWTTQQDEGAASAVSFLKRRVARIYSGYWPFCALAIGLFAWLGGPYLRDVAYLRSILLWPTPLSNLLIPVSWTLVFEMGFYVLFGFLVALPRRIRPACVAGLFLTMLGWTLFTQFVRHGYAPGRLEAMSIYEQYFAFPYLLEFLAGAGLAQWSRHRPGARGGALLVLAGGALFVTGGWINQQLFGGRLIQGYFVVPRVALFGSAALLIVAGLVRLEHGGWRLWPRFSLWLGGASYALYLFHTLALAAAHDLGFDARAAVLPVPAAHVAYLGFIALMIAYSVAHYRWVERPLHRMFRRGLRCQ